MRSTVAPSTFTLSRRLTIVGGLTAASFLALAGGAIAQTTTTSDSTTAAGRTGRPSPLTAEQRACLTAKGFGPKAKPAADLTTAAKTGPTEAERTADRAAREAAATACGVTLPSGGHRGRGPDGDGAGGPGDHHDHGPTLTTEQQACLTAKGFVRPAAPAAGSSATKPAAPTADQRAALEAAARACGIIIPVGGAHQGDHGGGQRHNGMGHGPGSAKPVTATTITA